MDNLIFKIEILDKMGKYAGTHTFDNSGFYDDKKDDLGHDILEMFDCMEDEEFIKTDRGAIKKYAIGRYSIDWGHPDEDEEMFKGDEEGGF